MTALVWIPHDGGPNPVREGETLVGVRFRDGDEEAYRRPAHEWRWSHIGHIGDITHYAVTPPRVAAPVTKPNAPMSADEVLIRAREALIEAYGWPDEPATQTRLGDSDDFTPIIAIIAYERDRAKPLAEVAPHTVEDADLVEARKLAVCYYENTFWPAKARECELGNKDEEQVVQSHLAAIKRGRELERGK